MGLEQCLGAHVLEDDVVVRVGQHDRVGKPVDHPEQPFLLDGVLFARVAQPFHIAGAYQRGARLRGERRHQPQRQGGEAGVLPQLRQQER